MDKLSRNAWQQRYDEGKTGWDRGASNPILRDWYDRELLQPCRIAVPGCGRGYEVVELAQLGFEVTAIDFAMAPVQQLRELLGSQNLEANVVQADVFSFQPETPFAAVYEQTCLCAIAPEERQDYAKQLAQWLEPGGRLFALFMQCDHLGRPGPPFHCDIEEMRRLFADDVWSWPADQPQRVDHPEAVHELATILTKLSTGSADSAS